MSSYICNRYSHFEESSHCRRINCLWEYHCLIHCLVWNHFYERFLTKWNINILTIYPGAIESLVSPTSIISPKVLSTRMQMIHQKLCNATCVLWVQLRGRHLSEWCVSVCARITASTLFYCSVPVADNWQAAQWSFLVPGIDNNEPHILCLDM